MSKLVLTLVIVGAFALCISAFPQAPSPPAPPAAPPAAVVANGQAPVPLAGGPPAPPPGSATLPPNAPKTLATGHCGGKDYNWDTAKESEPEEFKKCFYGDGPSFAMCGGKEFSWEPAKESKPNALVQCEKQFLG